MNEIKCTIIQDLLPLYIDEVVSDDTNAMVEEHLKSCEKCKKEYQAMTQDVYIPLQTETSLFKRIKKKWNYKKWVVASTSIALTVAVLFGGFYYVMHYETIIPYDEKLVKIELEDQVLQVLYYGEDYYGFHGAEPSLMEIDGVEKNVMFFYLTETIANSPSRNLFSKHISNEQKESVVGMISPDDPQIVDAIYYTPVDMDILSEPSTDSWDVLLEGATLIWEK
ncbi:zf-HC2 domain-containing protein [Solibacillus sp. FSL K6-1523]|uniref:zf-HC2 domain-containing protein n=1 Tax=Solibacillus sp. FSL K6-1523 TaxID=2921471 RepID=UPI0030F6E06A